MSATLLSVKKMSRGVSANFLKENNIGITKTKTTEDYETKDIKITHDARTAHHGSHGRMGAGSGL